MVAGAEVTDRSIVRVFASYVVVINSAVGVNVVVIARDSGVALNISLRMDSKDAVGAVDERGGRHAVTAGRRRAANYRHARVFRINGAGFSRINISPIANNTSGCHIRFNPYD